MSAGCQALTPQHTTDFTHCTVYQLSSVMLCVLQCAAVLGGYTGPPVPSRPFPVRGKPGHKLGPRGEQGGGKDFSSSSYFPHICYAILTAGDSSMLDTGSETRIADAVAAYLSESSSI